MWGKPEIVSTMNPAAFGTGEPFNMIKAAGYLPRPGISGAAWETTLKGPQRELDDPAFHEGGCTEPLSQCCVQRCIARAPPVCRPD